MRHPFWSHVSAIRSCCPELHRGKLQSSLRDLRITWAPYLDKHTPKSCRVLLAGTKADEWGEGGANAREVSKEDAKVSAT